MILLTPVTISCVPKPSSITRKSFAAKLKFTFIPAVEVRKVIRSNSVPPLIISFPDPPSIRSLPDPPFKTSSPIPPFKTSFPDPPLKVSLKFERGKVVIPAYPLKVSATLEPFITSI